MDYLDSDFNSKKKPLTGAGRTVQGELVTPTPANYTQPKALPNKTFIDGQVSRPQVGTQPSINAVNPVNQSATQSLTQLTKKPSLPPYQPAQSANPISQFGKIPLPTVGEVAGETAKNVGAISIAKNLSNGAGKLAMAAPAIQAGAIGSAIMNQENNFAKNIHAGSIADPNFGNELMGDKPQFSRTQTPPPKLTTGVIGVGRAGQQPVPEQFISSRAGRIENPAYKQYAVNHPEISVTQPATQPLRNIQVPALNTPTNPLPNIHPMDNQPAPKQYTPKLSGTESKTPTSMNDVTSGTGFIKGGNGAFKDGVGFTQVGQGKDSILSLSNGKTIDPNQPTYRTADGKGTITSNARPSLAGLSKRMDIDVLDHLAKQRESGAITAAEAGQIYDQYKLGTSSLAQQPQMAMQQMAAKGNIEAAQQLATQQYQQGTLDNQNRQTALDTSKWEHEKASKQFEATYNRLKNDALNGDKSALELLPKIHAMLEPNPKPLEKLKTSTKDAMGNETTTERLAAGDKATTPEEIRRFTDQIAQSAMLKAGEK